jgi:hypothetical protein
LGHTRLGIAHAFNLLSGPGTVAEAMEALTRYRRVRAGPLQRRGLPLYREALAPPRCAMSVPLRDRVVVRRHLPESVRWWIDD